MIDAPKGACEMREAGANKSAHTPRPMSSTSENTQPDTLASSIAAARAAIFAADERLKADGRETAKLRLELRALSASLTRALRMHHHASSGEAAQAAGMFYGTLRHFTHLTSALSPEMRLKLDRGPLLERLGRAGLQLTGENLRRGEEEALRPPR